VVSVAGRGPQRDRTWSEAYEAGKTKQPVVDIDYVLRSTRHPATDLIEARAGQVDPKIRNPLSGPTASSSADNSIEPRRTLSTTIRRATSKLP
jgi:hypothetical protein